MKKTTEKQTTKSVITPSGPKGNPIMKKLFMLALSFPKQALVFRCLQYKSFENTLQKKRGEIAHKEQSLPFPQCF